MENEFKFAGQTVPDLTIRYGIFLIAWAAVVSLVAESKSITSWIPAMIGAPILISGLLAKAKPAQKKVWMHAAVLFGLFAFFGGLDFFRGFASQAGAFANPAAAVSKLMLGITGGLFTVACLKSFIWARKSLEEGS